MADEYKKYICGKCNYRFSFRINSKKTLRCPYCGNSSLMEDKFDLRRMVDKL